MVAVVGTLGAGAAGAAAAGAGAEDPWPPKIEPTASRARAEPVPKANP